MPELTELDITGKPVISLAPLKCARKEKSLSVQIEKACFYLCKSNIPNTFVTLLTGHSSEATVFSTASRTVRYYIANFRKLTLSPPLAISLNYEVLPEQRLLKIVASARPSQLITDGFLK